MEPYKNNLSIPSLIKNKPHDHSLNPTSADKPDERADHPPGPLGGKLDRRVLEPDRRVLLRPDQNGPRDILSRGQATSPPRLPRGHRQRTCLLSASTLAGLSPG